MACESCDQPVEGLCKDFLNSNCVYISEELTCSGVEANTPLTATLKRLDDYICEVKNLVTTGASLVNIGSGSKIYKQVNSVGESEIKSLTSSDGSIGITEEEDTLDFSLNVEIPEIEDATEENKGIAEIATQEEVNLGEDDERFITPLKLHGYIFETRESYSLQIVDNHVELLFNGSVQDSYPLPTPTNTFPTSFELEGTDLVILLNNGTQLTQDLSSLLNFTQVQSNFTEEDSSVPSYIQNRNPSKVIYSNYTVQASDNNYVIVIDSNSEVDITIPSTLPNNHTTGFIQKSKSLVTINGYDILPEGFINQIKGIGHQSFIEKIEGTIFLFGNLKSA